MYYVVTFYKRTHYFHLFKYGVIFIKSLQLYFVHALACVALS